MASEKISTEKQTQVDPNEKEVPISSTSSGSSLHEDVEDGNYGSQGRHIFSDVKIAEYWRSVYEKAQYEGKHRFDPEIKWTPEEEKKLVKKIDLRIMWWTWLMFCALDLNRKNINRAISDTLLEDLGMNTNDFNYGQTIFLLSFLCAELPSGLISKKLGPDRWIPFIIVAWSVLSAAQAGITGKVAYYVIRCFLGLLMGGFIPDAVLYLTYFYKSRELPLRLAWFWTALSTCNIVGSLLAAGLLELRGRGGLAGWKWLFLIEGSVTAVIGVMSWFLMPAGPCQTAGILRGKSGWFSEREEYILVNRLLRDDPSKGDMHNRQAVNPAGLWKCMKDFDLWPLYLVGLTNYIPPSPPATYLTFILRKLGFSVFNANLLAIPSQFMFMINLLIVSRISQKLKERSIISSISNIWMFPFLVALVAIPGTISTWVRYGLVTGLLSYPYCHAILVAWNSSNSNTVRTRAVSSAFYNMFVQSGNIIASNIYRQDDSPLYKRGNKILLGINVFNVFLLFGVKYYYVKRNESRDKRWNAMTREEQEIYITTTKDEGSKRLDFRFVH
ncbi:major facilitator superfamily transporter [Ascobolus immersus RN42]|uniref:Major facilitator superfamily transporter n=1 Tax=Ascobolus immersus RN42 TaxID=1160509 RepID=A0A3N4I694_ASCIM|nr:major facilitator superfamily transporter [Ascobolus immersus RN42]